MFNLWQTVLCPVSADTPCTNTGSTINNSVCDGSTLTNCRLDNGSDVSSTTCTSSELNHVTISGSTITSSRLSRKDPGVPCVITSCTMTGGVPTNTCRISGCTMSSNWKHLDDRFRVNKFYFAFEIIRLWNKYYLKIFQYHPQLQNTVGIACLSLCSSRET